MDTLQRNTHFDLAASFVLHTNKNVYLTGRAGTGKTTFLKYIREHTNKKIAIAAPTGVAAINAGGVTMHSLFQLPIGSFIPEKLHAFSNSPSSGTDLNTLLRNIRFTREKRRLLQELELLVLDEVSMVRADMLDAADQILRHFRKNGKPFGGVQVLLIGDLHQLPPVVKEEDWAMLSSYYRSMFFFDALVLKEAMPVCIELQTIYRQSDEKFIHLLNAIRNNRATEEDLALLNKHYDPSFYPDADDGYIILTSHNYKADKINEGNLGRLPSDTHQFEGELQGDFNENALPVTKTLALKQGAQIMFIKNDKGENRRYYNGKIGIISGIRNGEIWVRFPGEGGEMKVEQETWRNIRYQYNETSDNISEETLGSYKQFPIRLAWAVTIHKSQGLTFDKAIIDAGQSFAPGQVYVALSRLTSLNGLVLSSPITPAAIFTESRISTFNESLPDDETLAQILQQAQEEYLNDLVTRSFGFAKLVDIFQVHHSAYNEMKIPHMGESLEWSRATLKSLSRIEEVARKFEAQLIRLLPGTGVVGYTVLAERVSAARDYFKKEIDANLLKPLEEHYKASDVKKGTKKYCRMLQSLRIAIHHKLDEMESIASITDSLAKGEGISVVMQQSLMKPKRVVEELASTSADDEKAPKEDTKSISLRLLKEGKIVEEIARDRSLTVGTVETHLMHYLPTGEVKLSDIVTPAQEAAVRQYIKQNGMKPTGVMKAALGEAVSFNAIRAVIIQMEQEKIWS